MPLPQVKKLVGPAGFVEWLRTEPRFRAAFQAVKDRAPHLLTQGMLHGISPLRGASALQVLRGLRGLRGLGQDELPTVTVTADSISSGGAFTVDPGLTPVSMDDVAAVGSTVPTYNTPVTTADPSQPGSQTGGWASTIAAVAQTAITGAEQVKLFNTQLSLAQQGKPLLNTSQMRLPTVPVGISFTGPSSEWLLPAAGIGLLAWVFLGRGRRRR